MDHPAVITVIIAGLFAGVIGLVKVFLAHMDKTKTAQETELATATANPAPAGIPPAEASDSYAAMGDTGPYRRWDDIALRLEKTIESINPASLVTKTELTDLTKTINGRMDDVEKEQKEALEKLEQKVEEQGKTTTREFTKLHRSMGRIEGAIKRNGGSNSA